MEQEMDMGKKLNEEFNKLKKEIKKPNILLAGATGVGKSSLVNMIFGSDLAIVGTGKPVTEKIDVFESENSDVRLFDSKGYELGQNADDEFYESVVGLAKQDSAPEKQIHLIWYCIGSNSNRVTDYDLKAIRTFSEAHLPLAVIFTKDDLVTDEEMAEMRNAIPSELSNCIFETTTSKNPEVQKYNHVEELIEWSIQALPESLRYAFIKSQKTSLKEKWQKSHTLIIEHTAGAFAVGCSPIPFSDAPLLVANELGLLARILYLYDLGSLKEFLGTTGISSIIGPLLTTAGKSIVVGVLKLIPGIGTVAGGLISGSVGAAVTGAFGEAVSASAYGIANAKLSGDEVGAGKLIKSFASTVGNLTNEYISQKKTKDDYSVEDL